MKTLLQQTHFLAIDHMAKAMLALHRGHHSKALRQLVKAKVIVRALAGEGSVKSGHR